MMIELHKPDKQWKNFLITAKSDGEYISIGTSPQDAALDLIEQIKELLISEYGYKHGQLIFEEILDEILRQP